VDDIKSLIPAEGKLLGQRHEVHGVFRPLREVDWKSLGVEKGSFESSMQAVGRLLDRFLIANPEKLRIFSPDELVSNKLNAVFDNTGRNFQWDEYSRAQGGRVIETLSEHQCQGFLQGYTLTGRVGVFPSYESFLGIVHTMMVQYSKFNKMVR
jgi:xylulose-5-phosphate/fructose-6-phosphate phosphoketolase